MIRFRSPRERPRISSASSTVAAPRSTCSTSSASPAAPKPRWGDRRHITAVLGQLEPGSVTRVRLELMNWTVMCPSQMGRLHAEDFRLDEPIPYVAVRRGKGGRLTAVPRVPDGVPAARAFLDANAFGAWPRSSVNRTHSPAQPAAPAGRRSPPTRSATRSPRDSGAPGRTWPTSRTGMDTRPETTMIYAPPKLEKHLAALERLRRTTGTGTLFPAAPAALAAEVDRPDSA